MSIPKRLLYVTVPAVVLTACVASAAMEVWVRLRWDERRGTPGLFVSDPVRVEKLAADYTGWFAGVPVRINKLGFRDTREYELAKTANTFRILVLGDSVTFGHGSIYEHTWPLLLEQRLNAWRSGVDWQVWNLGVPGYNTSQELAHLLDVGPRFKPDLVVVGFFGNDVVDNAPVTTATRRAVWASEVKTFLRRHVYSADVYRKQYLLLRARWSTSTSERALVDNMTVQEQLLARLDDVADLEAQRLTHPRPMTDEEIADQPPCAAPVPPSLLAALEQTGRLASWMASVEALQRLHRDGVYRIAFFINAAPDICPDRDVFDDRVTKPLNEYLLSVLGRGTAAVSSHDAFRRFRPSDVPNAGAHSIGNANEVKSDVLFQFLRDRVLTPLPAGTHSRAATR